MDGSTHHILSWGLLNPEQTTVEFCIETEVNKAAGFPSTLTIDQAMASEPTGHCFALKCVDLQVLLGLLTAPSLHQ